MSEKLSIVYATPSVSRLFTGVYEVERNVALELKKLNINVEIFGLEDKFTEADLKYWSPLMPSVHKISGPTIIGYSKTYLQALMSSTGNVGHIHSLWSYTAYALYKWSKTNNYPYMLTANGYLDDWALNKSKIKKKIALNIVFKKVLSAASCIQVNSEHEYQSVRKLGLTNPVCLISNGVNLPDLAVEYCPPWHCVNNTKNKKVLLYLSRIHQKKGVHLLVDAWNHLNAKKLLADWHLVVVGFSNPMTPYERQIMKYIKENKLLDVISTLEGQYSEKMMSCYSNCDAFILPSFSEGAAIAALNAWAFSKPALITPNCNLADGFDADAGIEIEPDTQSIISGILKVINFSEDKRKKMGANGRKLVEVRYSWKAVTIKILEVYNWLHLKNGLLPSTLIKD